MGTTDEDGNVKYLVMMQCGMDDVPIRLFDLEDDARAFAKSMAWRIPDEISESLDVSVSVFCHISIYEIKDGHFVGRTVVRSYDDEQGPQAECDLSYQPTDDDEWRGM